MGRKYIKIFEKPHVIFWGAIPLLLLISFIRKIEMESSALDINIHDTYFVIAHSHFTLLVSVLIAFLGFIYFLSNKLKIILNVWLNLIHTLITIFGTLFISYPFTIVLGEQGSRFTDRVAYENAAIVIVILILVGCQLLLLINLILGILKKRTK